MTRPCLLCGGEEYTEDDDGGLILCPRCHGTGDDPVEPDDAA